MNCYDIPNAQGFHDEVVMCFWLERCRDSQFDPAMVDAFLAVLAEEAAED